MRLADWTRARDEAVLRAAQEVLDALGVEIKSSAARNKIVASLSKVFAAGANAGSRPSGRNLERERIYGRAYVRNGHRPPSAEQIEAMKLEITRPFGAPIDGAPGE